ncbi:unnamed protein product [Prorocentrum cordatum]|uniref:Uncharacterized protein n=1 Tax=Prorocentrum cordatum TaxID=2364126 RepID=A0ABN9Y066_9DINO|nr:unnamed protein product [Polarella glacialis]
MAGMTHIKDHLEDASSKQADRRGVLVRLWYASRCWRALLCALPGLAEAPVSWALELIDATSAARVDMARQWCDEQLEKCGSFALAAMRAVLGKARELSVHAFVYTSRGVPQCLRKWLPATTCPSPQTGEHEADFNLIASAFQPVLFNIAGFACSSPEELVALTTQTSKSVAAELTPARNDLWGSLYKQRWPAFHDFLHYQGLQRWDGLYEDTLAGKTEAVLEIFDREKKLGFAMAAMGARVTFEASSRSYVARYLSACEVPPEHIPKREEHRLRCCPPAVRDALRPGPPPDPGDPHGPTAGLYLDRVLEGSEGLRPGAGIELQWKMQEGSPFGWWYGRLDALEHDRDGVLATATVTFVHFPSQSRWRTLRVRFGDSQMRPCSFGGFTGGIRSTTEVEQKHWMNFFPRKAAVL